MKRDVSCVILAAGNSSRMNFPKPLLPFEESQNFIERILDTYCDAGINEIILVVNVQTENEIRKILSNNYPYQNFHVVVNRYPVRGRFFSIQLGLQLVKNKSCFLQNIDNPFITPILLNEMMMAKEDAEYVVPCYKGRQGHPVLISNRVLKHLLLLKGHDHNLKDELSDFSKCAIDVADERILANINTVEDYERYFSKCETLF